MRNVIIYIMLFAYSGTVQNGTFYSIEVVEHLEYQFHDDTLVNGRVIPIGYIEYISKNTGYPKSWIAALLIYETNWFRSRLWKDHNNPAGIVYTKRADSKTWSSDEGGQYKSSYTDLKKSADDLIRILKLKRYKGLEKSQTAFQFFKTLYECGFFSDKRSISRRAVLAEQLFFLDFPRIKKYKLYACE